MVQLNSSELREHSREILDAVEHKGQHVTVLRYGKPGAVVVPVEWYEQAKVAIEEQGQ